VEISKQAVAMSNSSRVEIADPHTELSIGEVAELTGVSVATLRVWESRHGFPRPHRRKSGHRRYSSDVVEAVRDVVRRRERGMRLDIAILQSSGGDDVPVAPLLTAVPAHVQRGSKRTPAPRKAKASDGETTAAASGTRPSEPVATSIYAHLRQAHPGLAPQRLSKATLLAMSWAMEDEFLSRPQPGARIFGTFQKARYYASAAARWDDLARTTASTHVFADFDRASGQPAGSGDPDGSGEPMGAEGPTAPVRVTLAATSPLNQEWAVVCDGPHLPLALSAWELPGQHDLPERDRLFEAVWTLDSQAVRGAARVCAEAAVAAGAPGAAEARAALEASVESVEVDPQTITSLFGRVVGYVDRG
jgi:MerR family transcriptional regulator, light-induced transcriptional regulator